jgi:phosphoribosyl 1,2-cyclic phosphodiesterase
MKVTFLGTRGEIEARTRQHGMHSSPLITRDGCAVLIDCGADWLKPAMKLRLNAIFLTHAHSDHTGGPRNGAPCEVFATGEAWEHYGVLRFKTGTSSCLAKPSKYVALRWRSFRLSTHQLLSRWAIALLRRTAPSFMRPTLSLFLTSRKHFPALLSI